MVVSRSHVRPITCLRAAAFRHNALCVQSARSGRLSSLFIAAIRQNIIADGILHTCQLLLSLHILMQLFWPIAMNQQIAFNWYVF